MLALVVQNHPNRTGPDFRREFVRRLACHGSHLLKSWSLRQSRGGSLPNLRAVQLKGPRDFLKVGHVGANVLQDCVSRFVLWQNDKDVGWGAGALCVDDTTAADAIDGLNDRHGQLALLHDPPHVFMFVPDWV